MGEEADGGGVDMGFLLGYLTQLLPRRPDLKLVITSATIDPHRFADHFTRATGVTVPVVEVSGRTYPVEIRYRPLIDDTAPDSTVDDALASDSAGDSAGDSAADDEVR